MIVPPAKSQKSGLASRLILGTAQFGMAYGITNRRGQISTGEAEEILIAAQRAGIGLLDTAAGYGESEAVLGKCRPLQGFGIVTKIPPIDGDTVGPQQVQAARDAVSRSLDRLRVPQLYGLLVHHSGDLLKPGAERLVELLASLKSDGIVVKTGFSVYVADEIDQVMKMFRPDLIQLPLNIFDQRLLGSGHIAKLRAAGIEIHCRSVFLQGVLLTDAGQRPAYFDRFDGTFRKYAEFVSRHRISPLQASLGFALTQGGIDGAVVGITSVEELDQIVGALPLLENLPAMNDLSSSDLALIDPRAWPRQSRGAGS